MNQKNKTESAIVISFSIITVLVIGVLAFAIFSSSNFLNDNKPYKANTNDNTTNQTPAPTNPPPSATDTPTTPQPPPIKQPIEKEIATYSSNIYDNEAGRIHNIALAISKLNGVIIKQGETFSFNGTVGAMGQEQGYKKAIGFDTNGKKIQVFGGGMCQISSTMYNTALIAGLEIVERHPHSRRVYYVPKDKDATIYYGSLDLKFKNTTDGDIKILASSSKANVTITFNKIVNE